MNFFVKLGGFFGEHLIFTAIWFLLINLLCYVLCSEDENRAAHKKPRFKSWVLVLPAMLGGSLGALIGYICMHTSKKQNKRGVIYSLLLIIQLTVAVLCILKAPESPTVYWAAFIDDFRSLSDWIGSKLSGISKGLLIYVIVLDFITLIMFGADKICAVRKKSRIPEKVLLTATFIGGGLGALIGMILFRHKIRHGKFYICVPVALLIQIFVMVSAFN